MAGSSAKVPCKSLVIGTGRCIKTIYYSQIQRVHLSIPLFFHFYSRRPPFCTPDCRMVSGELRHAFSLHYTLDLFPSYEYTRKADTFQSLFPIRDFFSTEKGGGRFPVSVKDGRQTFCQFACTDKIRLHLCTKYVTLLLHKSHTGAYLTLSEDKGMILHQPFLSCRCLQVPVTCSKIKRSNSVYGKKLKPAKGGAAGFRL